MDNSKQSYVYKVKGINCNNLTNRLTTIEEPLTDPASVGTTQ